MLLFICLTASPESEPQDYYYEAEGYEFLQPIPEKEDEGDLSEYKKWEEQAKKNPPYLVFPPIVNPCSPSQRENKIPNSFR